MLSREVMATMVTWPGLGEADKRGRPRVPTHHPLIFQNHQALLPLTISSSLITRPMPRISSTKYRIHDVSITRTEMGRYRHVRGHIFAAYPLHPLLSIALTSQGLNTLMIRCPTCTTRTSYGAQPFKPLVSRMIDGFVLPSRIKSWTA